MLKLANNLDLPLEFATERIAFLARTGAGKSGGMRVMLEQLFDAGIFSIFVDPKGDTWGIRGDGTGKGRKVLVIGGDHGDLPLEPTAGKVVAEFLIRERVTTIVDISDFGHAEMWRFCAAFFGTLYKLNRDVAHLFVDEVDMIAGQQFFDPLCLNGLQLLQNKGRSRGWGVTVASQRPQMVNNTVLNGSGSYIVMQTIGDDALKVVKRLLGAAASKEVINEIMSNLPVLQPRDAFVYSPQTLGLEPRRIFFDAFTTFDSMRTPKPGEKRQTPKSLADIDLGAVQREMAATIEKAKADDPALLKKKIAELERELKAKPAVAQTGKVEVQTKTVEIEKPVPFLDEVKLGELSEAVDIFWQGVWQGIETVTAAVNDLRKQKPDTVAKLIAQLRKAKPTLPAGLKSPGIPVRSSNLPPTRIKPAAPSGRASTPITENSTLSSERSQFGEKPLQILDTLLTFERLGHDQVDKGVIAAFIGVKASGSTMRGYYGGLSNAGVIKYPVPGTVALTDAGRAVAASTVEINGVEDLHDAWRRLVGSEKIVEILNLVIENHPDPVSRLWVADQIGVEMKGSTMRGYLGTLRNFGIVDYVTIRQDDEDVACLKATDLLFPEGLS